MGLQPSTHLPMMLVSTTSRNEDSKGLGAWMALEQRLYHLGCHLQPPARCLPAPCPLLYSQPGLGSQDLFPGVTRFVPMRRPPEETGGPCELCLPALAFLNCFTH